MPTITPGGAKRPLKEVPRNAQVKGVPTHPQLQASALAAHPKVYPKLLTPTPQDIPWKPSFSL